MFVSRGTCTSEKCTYRLINLLELKTKEEKLDIEVIRGTPRFVVVQDSPFEINWEHEHVMNHREIVENANWQ